MFNLISNDEYEIVEGDLLYKINGGACTGSGSGVSVVPPSSESETKGNNPPVTIETVVTVEVPSTETGTPSQEIPENQNKTPVINPTLPSFYPGGTHDTDISGSIVVPIVEDGKENNPSIIEKGLDNVKESITDLWIKTKNIVNQGWYNATKFHFEDRDAKNIIIESYEEILNSAIENKNWKLMSSELSKYHQNGYGQQELKFICRDGREAVFSQDYSNDGSYKLVTDPKYKGTYNYVTPSFENDSCFQIIGSSIGHFTYDMVPYYLTGCKNER